MVKKRLDKKEKILAKFKADIESIKEEVRNDVLGPVVASFGFIIALIWRDAIQSSIHEFLQRMGLTGKEYIYQFISAMIVTIIVITIMITVTKIGRKKKKEYFEKKIEQKQKQIEKELNKK
jgi:H+/gluconate symporter-like permease